MIRTFIPIFFFFKLMMFFLSVPFVVLMVNFIKESTVLQILSRDSHGLSPGRKGLIPYTSDY